MHILAYDLYVPHQCIETETLFALAAPEPRKLSWWQRLIPGALKRAYNREPVNKSGDYLISALLWMCLLFHSHYLCIY